MPTKLLKNANVLTLNHQFDVFMGYDVLIEGDTIKSISKNIEVSNAEVFDLSNKWLMPGFINTHTHLPMTIFRGLADDLPLHEWLNDKIWPAEKAFLNDNSIRIGARLGMLEMIKAGTTTFNDMYFFGNTIAEELEKSGMRGLIGESVIDFPTKTYANVEEALSINKELITKYRNHPTVHPSISAHAPYSCSAETLVAVKELANSNSLVYNIHISETQKEVNDLVKQTGKRPVNYLNDLGVLDDKTVGAHCVWLNNEEIDVFKDAGSHVSHNPSSNLKLGCGFAPVSEYIESGINVSLGTDGAASNNNTDILEEMRLSTLIHKGTSKNPTVLNAKTSLHMVTQNGANAIGMGKHLGSIEEGKLADLLILDLDKPATTPIYDVHSTLVYAAHSGQIQSVLVNGNFIMKNREVLFLEEEKIKKDAVALASKIQREL